MTTNYIFLADGFEEIEAITPVDVLRRAGLNAKTVSIMPGRLQVLGANGVPVVADMGLDEVDADSAGWLILPGGMPGATNLYKCATLREMLLAHAEQGGCIAAICASPAVVLGQLGLLRGRRATCYPGMEQMCEGATMADSYAVTDGNIVTGQGPAAALAFAYAIVEASGNADTAAQVAQGMLYTRRHKN